MCFFLRASFLLRIAGGGTPHPLLFSHRRPLVPTPLPFAFSISINIFFPMCFFLRTSCLVYISQPAPLGTYSYSFCFRHQHQGFGFLCASFFVLLSWYALRGEALRFSRSFLSWASTIWIDLVVLDGDYFLRASCLVRIAGGGAAPSPLHPPTRFYCVTGAPCSRLFFRLLFPSAPPPPAFMFYPVPLATYSYSFCFFRQLQGFAFLCASFFVLLSCYALRGEALRPPPCDLFLSRVYTMLYCMLTCFTWSHNSLVHAHSAWLKTSSNSCVYKKCLPLTAWLRCLSSCPGLPQRGKLPQSGSGACAFAKSRSVCRTPVLCIRSVYRTCGGNL